MLHSQSTIAVLFDSEQHFFLPPHHGILSQLTHHHLLRCHDTLQTLLYDHLSIHKSPQLHYRRGKRVDAPFLHSSQQKAYSLHITRTQHRCTLLHDTLKLLLPVPQQGTLLLEAGIRIIRRCERLHEEMKRVKHESVEEVSEQLFLRG